MSPSPSVAPPRLLDLKHLPTESIVRNPENPRLHFPQIEIDRLTESISLQGILVPVVVSQSSDEQGQYVLIDGERRWICANNLGLAEIPAVISKEPDATQNLLQMFNIHQVREAWQDMPTAWALGRYIELTGVESDKELSDQTGVSTDRIKRLRHALRLPKEYQTFIDDKVIPLNFFWELHQNVIQPLSRLRPSLWQEFADDEVQDAMVKKRVAGVIADSVSFRDVAQIIKYAAREVEGDPSKPSILDETLRELIRDPARSIEDAYADTIQLMVEADRLERSTHNMVASFSRLLSKAHNVEERTKVQQIGRSLIDQLRKILS